MYTVCWTINKGNNDLEDFFTLHESEGEAMAQYQVLCETVEDLHGRQQNYLHCAAVSKVKYATEPHWVD